MGRRSIDFTVEKLSKMNQLYSEGKNTIDIGKEVDLSGSFVTRVFRAQRGDKRYIEQLPNYHIEVINEYNKTNSKNNNTENVLNYYFECRIFFGLITLKFKPKKVL